MSIDGLTALLALGHVPVGGRTVELAAAAGVSGTGAAGVLRGNGYFERDTECTVKGIDIADGADDNSGLIRHVEGGNGNGAFLTFNIHAFKVFAGEGGGTG